MRTKDPRRVETSYDVRTVRARLNWSFDGTGTVNAAGVWTQTGAGVDVPSSFTVFTDGSTWGGPSANFNESVLAETWIVEDQ